MELVDYLWENRLHQKDFCKIINISPQYLSLICSYKKVPGFKVAFKIEDATNGKVKAKEILKKCLDYKLSKFKPEKPLEEELK